MDFLDVLGIGATAASGGVFGLLGSLIGGAFKFFQAKQAHKEKMEWADKEMAMARLDMKRDAAFADNEAKLIAAHRGHGRGYRRPTPTMAPAAPINGPTPSRRFTGRC